MDEIVIQLEKKLYKKLLLVALQNHSTINEVITDCLIKTLFTEDNKKQRPIEVSIKLYHIQQIYGPYLNDWEANFFSGLIKNPYQLTQKQIKQVNVILMKYPELIEQINFD